MDIDYEFQIKSDLENCLHKKYKVFICDMAQQRIKAVQDSKGKRINSYFTITETWIQRITNRLTENSDNKFLELLNIMYNYGYRLKAGTNLNSLGILILRANSNQIGDTTLYKGICDPIGRLQLSIHIKYPIQLYPVLTILYKGNKPSVKNTALEGLFKAGGFLLSREP